VARGEVPQSEWQRMRCPYQDGEFPFPVKYGYCSVGEIEAGPANLLGQLVFALYPHQDRYWLPAATAQPLPPGLPPKRAILSANMETAMNVVWDSGASLGDRIVVVGAGTLGLLIASLLARLPGTEVSILDANPKRGAIAKSLGLNFAVSYDPQAWPQAPADLVINASGSQTVWAEALEALGEEGTMIEASWLGAPAAIPLNGAFHSKRLTIKSSQVGQLPPHRRPRWGYSRRLAKAMELLRDAPHLEALVTHEFAFDDLPSVMARLCDDWDDALTVAVAYQ